MVNEWQIFYDLRVDGKCFDKEDLPIDLSKSEGRVVTTLNFEFYYHS